MPELTARLRLIADIRQFAGNIQRGAQQAKTALSGLDRQVGNVGTGLKGANQASKSFFQTLKSNVGTQIKAGIMFATLYQALITFRQTIGAAVAELFNLDESLRKVQSISKDADETIKALKNQLIKAAREGKLFGQTAAEVATGMFEIVQAGFDTAEAFEIATVAAQAATAGFTDAATAGKVITGAILAFDLTAAHAREVANILFQTVDTGVVTFEQLAQGLGVAMSPAALLNVSLEELGAAVALMTRKGIPANRAMTSLTRILFAFLDPSDKAFKAAEDMGFALDAQTVKTHGLLGAMQLLNEATGGNEELLADVFDRQRALIGAFSLLADGGEDWAGILVEMNGAQADAGALTAAWEERSKALTVRLGVLRAQVLAVIVQGLQPLADGLGVVADWMSRMIADEMGVFKWLKDTATEVTGLSEAWNGFVDALKDMFVEGTGNRLQLMFWGMFVVLREGIPVLFELLALLLRVGAWALRNKPVLIAVALAFGIMFVSAHPLLAVFQALFLLVGHMEKNWDDWRVRIGGTTAAVLLAVLALQQLWNAFKLTTLAGFLFRGATNEVGLFQTAIRNLGRAAGEMVAPVVRFFDELARTARDAATHAWKVANGLKEVLARPVNIARTVTVTTVQAVGEKAEEVRKVGAEAVKKGLVGGLVQGLAKGIGAGVGAAIIAGLVLAIKAAAIGIAAALGISVGVLVAVIAAVLIAAIVAGFLIYKYREEIWAGLKTLGRVLKEFFTTQLPEYMRRYFLEPMQRLFTEILPAWAKTLGRVLKEFFAERLPAYMIRYFLIPMREFFTKTLPEWAKRQFTAENMGRWFGRFLMGAILLVFWPPLLVYKFRDKLLYFVGRVAGFLAKLPGRIASKIGDAAGIILDWLVDTAKWVAAFEVRVRKFQGKVASFIAEIPGRIASKIGDAAGIILDWLVDTAKWVAAFEVRVRKFQGKVASFIAEIPGRIAAFIADRWKDVIDWLVDAAKWVAHFELKIGQWLARVAETMAALPGKIAAFIGDHWKDIITFLVNPEDWWNEFKTLVQNFVDIVKERIGPILSAIGNFFSESIAGGIAAAFSGLVEAIRSAVKAALRRIPGPIKAFLGGILPGAQDVLDWAEGGAGPGEPSQPWWKPFMRGYEEGAHGIRNFAGGMALVGERGAELVRLPRGSDVFRAEDTGQALRGGAGGLSVSAEVNITTSLLKDFLEMKRLLLKEVDRKLDDAAARVGMAKPRYGTWGAGQPRI